MNLPEVTLADVLEARKRIRPYIVPTPAHRYHGLDSLFGCNLWIKHENHHPTGAFKVRGGINLCAGLSAASNKAGVFAASTGNHGQSVAYAARCFDMPATIYVPEDANPDKVRAIRSFGAEVVFYGENYETCRHACEKAAATAGARFISGGNEPDLIAGVGTYALELFESVPDLDHIYVPVGGGSGACGCCIVGRAMRPGVRIVGVQSSHAPAVYRSWKSGERVQTERADTFAEGLATLAPFHYPLELLRRHLDAFELVEDAELREAIRVLFSHTHNVAEGAGAAAFAAAWRDRESLRGAKVAVVMSGGNLTSEMLAGILTEQPGASSGSYPRKLSSHP